MRAFKVFRPDFFGNRFCVYRDAATIADAEINESEVGDLIRIEVIEMAEAELDALPEFDGW